MIIVNDMPEQIDASRHQIALAFGGRGHQCTECSDAFDRIPL
jgi:hypothetical protein